MNESPGWAASVPSEPSSDVLRVLVADDEPLVRAGIVGILVVTTFGEDHGNGRDALAAARLLRLNAVVLDTRMPGLSGLEVISELRRDGSAMPCLGGRGDQVAGGRVRAQIRRPATPTCS